MTTQLNLFKLEEIKINEDEGKVCTSCKQFLPFSAFVKDKGGTYSGGVRGECKPCATKLRNLGKELKRLHGDPPEDHSCPICNKKEDTTKSSGNKHQGFWVRDHCHETDTFRGHICHKCNKALGMFHDDTDNLKRAIEYLENHLRKTFLV